MPGLQKRLWAAIRGRPGQRMQLHEQLQASLSACSSREALQTAVLQAAEQHPHWDALPEVCMRSLRQSAAALCSADPRLALSWQSYGSSCREWLQGGSDVQHAAHGRAASTHAGAGAPTDQPGLHALDAYMQALAPWATALYNDDTLCLDAHGVSLPLAALVCHQNKLLFRLCTALGMEPTPANQAALVRSCPGLLHSAVRVVTDARSREVQGYESMSGWDFKMLHYEVLAPELGVGEAYSAALVLAAPHELMHHERVWTGYDAQALRRRLMELRWCLGR